MAIKVHNSVSQSTIALLSYGSVEGITYRLTSCTVFAWYLAHGLDATPLNPSSSSISVRSQSYSTIPSPSSLETPSDYSLSVITPPKVTRKLLQEARKVGIRAVWLQPGTFDDEILQYVRNEWPDAHLAGFHDPPGTEAHDGWCVLVEGEKGMKLAALRDTVERL